MVEQWVYSSWLIFGIVVLFFINLACIPLDQNEMLFWMTLVIPIVTVLIGGYIFTYRGRKHVAARVIFTILLLLSMLSIWSYVYILGLAGAFKN